MATKTKNELLEEIEQKNEEIKELHGEVERLDTYKQYDQAANEIKAIMDSFVRAGFSDEQSFALLQNLITANSPKPVNISPTFIRRG